MSVESRRAKLIGYRFNPNNLDWSHATFSSRTHGTFQVPISGKEEFEQLMNYTHHDFDVKIEIDEGQIVGGEFIHLGVQVGVPRI